MLKQRRHLSCRAIISTFALILLLIGLLPLALPASRQWPAKILIEKPVFPEKADAIIVLMGDVNDRIPYAAELWKRGVAPKIVFVNDESTPLQERNLRLSDGETTYRYLLQLDVPAEALIYNRKTAVSSTFEEAAAAFQTVQEELPEAKHLIICTSWYHSSRAAWVYRHLNPAHYQITSSSSPAPEVWYAKEINFLAVFNEYLKWVLYLLKY